MASQGVKTTQELLRHSTPTVPTGIYVQAVREKKREARNKITELVIPKGTETRWQFPPDIGDCPQGSRICVGSRNDPTQAIAMKVVMVGATGFEPVTSTV